MLGQRLDAVERLRVGNRAAVCDERGAVGIPLLGREVEQKLARGGPGLAQLRSHVGRGAAAEGAHVVRGERGVAHDQADAGDGRAKLFRDGLRERCADALSHLDLAGEDRDGAGLVDV